MPQSLLSGREADFLVLLGLSVLCGYMIGAERESRGKPAGVSTHCLVIGGAAFFTFLSAAISPGSPGRVAAQVVTGIGFLGAGIIMRTDSGAVSNLTTAASIWFAAAIGMAIGVGWHAIALLAALYSTIVPRLPSRAHREAS